jgi:replicative DNA helicase
MESLDGVPFHKEAERELVCSLMAGPDYIPRIAAEVDPSYFFSANLRAIYGRLIRTAHAGEEINEITFSDGESDDNKILIMRLFDNAITGTTAPHWAKKVREHAYARSIYDLGNTFLEKASDLANFQEADAFLRSQTEKVLDKFNMGVEDTYSPDDIDGICAEIQKKRTNPGIHGPKTLFPILDNAIRGIKLITLVTAPSGFGKTALGLQWAWNISVVQKTPSLYINYEMGEDELVERILSCGSGVPLEKIQLGETDEAEYSSVEIAREGLRDGQLYLTGCESKQIDNTVNLIHQYAQQKNIKVVFIDYLGEIEKKDSEYSQNSYTLYGDWLQKIKNTCARLGVRAVVLAQLNRDGYDGVPSMQSVSESMKIVHQAHVAIGLYENRAGVPMLKIMKNRAGPILQPIPLTFNRPCQQISEQ